MAEDVQQQDHSEEERWVQLIGGLQARRKVALASGWRLDEAEEWIRRAIWNGDTIEAWYKPIFLSLPAVPRDDLDMCFQMCTQPDVSISYMNDFDLTDVCITEVSLDEAIAANFPTAVPLAEGVASDIPFLVAANHVSQQLGVPIDAAKAALSNAISGGAVKAWRPPDEYDPRAKAKGRPMASEIFRTLLDIAKPRIDLGPRRRMYKTDEGDAVVDVASMAEWTIRFGLALGSPVDGVASRDDGEHAVCEIAVNDKLEPPSEENGNTDKLSRDSEYGQRLHDEMDEIRPPAPPRPSVLFAIASDSVQKRGNYSEKAAEAWLSEAIRDRLEAWIYRVSTSGLNEEGWIRTKNVREAERLYVSIEDLEGALSADFPVEKPNQQRKKKRGPRSKDIGRTVVAETAVWAHDEALDPSAHGALQRVRDYMTNRLIAHGDEVTSDETVRQWAHDVLNALKGQNTSN